MTDYELNKGQVLTFFKKHIGRRLTSAHLGDCDNIALTFDGGIKIELGAMPIGCENSSIYGMIDELNLNKEE